MNNKHTAMVEKKIDLFLTALDMLSGFSIEEGGGVEPVEIESLTGLVSSDVFWVANILIAYGTISVDRRNQRTVYYKLAE